MDYRRRSAADLATDQKFQKWVLNPDAETSAFWEQWLRENPDQKVKVTDAIELIQSAGLSSDDQLNDRYLDVWKNIHENAVRPTQIRQVGGFRYAKIAAVFIGLIVGSFILWKQFGAENVVEYRTTYGETRDVLLEDGSRVTLNSNTVLTLKKNWDEEKAREVFLDGEAFFEVVKTNDKKTFQVKTKDEVFIRVLGTEFNVNTRHQQVEVYLQSGRVRINSLGGNAILKPGDFMVYQKGNKSIVIKENELENSLELLGWKSDFFVFNDTPMTEIVEALEDDYGFRVAIDDASIDQKKITAKVSRKNVGVLLKVISETLNIEIEQEGKQLTFKERK